MESYVKLGRIAIGALLIALFCGIAYFNAISLWKRNIRGERYPSGVPLVGGLFGAIGLWLLPVPGIARFAWLALVLDYGSLPYLLGVSLYLAHDSYVHSRHFQVLELEGRENDGTKSRLTLYRNGDCILKQTEMPPPCIQRSRLGAWKQKETTLVFEFAERTIRFAPIAGSSTYQWVTASETGLLDGVELHITQRTALR